MVWLIDVLVNFLKVLGLALYLGSPILIPATVFLIVLAILDRKYWRRKGEEEKGVRTIVIPRDVPLLRELIWKSYEESKRRRPRIDIVDVDEDIVKEDIYKKQDEEGKKLSFSCNVPVEVEECGESWRVLKTILEESFCPRDEPLAMLIVGPPGCGKTWVVKQICEGLGNECLYLRAEQSYMTGAGLRETLLKGSWKLIVIDEVDKARDDVLEALISILDPLIHAVHKTHAREREYKTLRTKFILIANSIEAIRKKARHVVEPLLDRVIIVQIREKCNTKTIAELLAEKLGIDKTLAEIVAQVADRKKWSPRKIETALKLVSNIRDLEKARKILETIQ